MTSDELARLRADRDALERRALEAEALAEALADELAATRARARADAQAETTDAGPLDLFADADADAPTAAPPAGDRAVVPVALGSTALVAVLIGVLAVALDATVFGVVMLAVGAALAWGAWQTRVVPVDVQVADGVVRVTRSGDTKRFDLANAGVRIDVQGRPGDDDWRVRFYRGRLDPVDVDASMVDPAAFMRLLREHRRAT